ncbi:flagellar biosynthesis anti-sigma factor FlgM [Lysobacter sp. TY2-98]|nr:flagellar biosynthesis anti-sigma factor FlgM [Lysobacter sp. TY2-98]
MRCPGRWSRWKTWNQSGSCGAGWSRTGWSKSCNDRSSEPRRKKCGGGLKSVHGAPLPALTAHSPEFAMTSKIDGLSPSPARVVDTAASPSVARAGTDRSKPVVAAPAADSVRLTGEATGLQAAVESQLGQPAPLDMAKVNAVRAALDDGSYQINPQDIANRLVALERQMRG